MTETGSGKSECGKRKKKKVRSWEGGKVGLEVGSWNAERGKKEGGKDRGWEILRMGNLE